jgi:hypothetical protein
MVKEVTRTRKLHENGIRERRIGEIELERKSGSGGRRNFIGKGVSRKKTGREQESWKRGVSCGKTSAVVIERRKLEKNGIERLKVLSGEN